MISFKIELNLMGSKSNATYVFSHNYAKIEVDSYDSLPLEEKLTFHVVIKHIKSVSNKEQNHYYYNIFLEKCFYQLPKTDDKK